jgi:hypothetical protein
MGSMAMQFRGAKEKCGKTNHVFVSRLYAFIFLFLLLLLFFDWALVGWVFL